MAKDQAKVQAELMQAYRHQQREERRLFGNIVWFTLGGWYLGLTWLLGAVLFALTIVGLPLTKAAIEMAKMSALPFGKDVVHVRDIDQKGVDAGTATTGTIGFIFNILWACTLGWVLFLMYIVAGIISCVTILLIPFGIQAFKLAGISFWPVGRRVVTIEMAKAIRERNAKQQLETLDKSPAQEVKQEEPKVAE